MSPYSVAPPCFTCNYDHHLQGVVKIYNSAFEQFREIAHRFTHGFNRHIQENEFAYSNHPAYSEPTNSSFKHITPKKGVDQSIMIDDQYRLDVTKNGKGSSTFKVYDKAGKEIVGEWGDPHITGKNGAAVGDLQCNHVITLPHGQKIGVRVSKADGSAPVPGQPDYVSEITVVSAGRHDAMNINMNLGSNSQTTSTGIPGRIGQDFIGQTLNDHGSFLGAQLGMSQDGTLVDPLTGLPMNSKRLKEIDMNNGDPKVRSAAISLAQAQDLFEKGHMMPCDHHFYYDRPHKAFTPEMRDICIENLQMLLQHMGGMRDLGCDCSVQIPNHINCDAHLQLHSVCPLPQPYGNPILAAVYSPAMAKHMPEGAACKVLAEYLSQVRDRVVSLKDLKKLACDPSIPTIVRNACEFMINNKNAWKKIETLDTGGKHSDNISGVGNFINRAQQLGANNWDPTPYFFGQHRW